MARCRQYARCVLSGLLCAVATVVALKSSADERRENPQTGLWIWTKVEAGFSLELIQLHGDYVSAVFISRGFTPAMLEQLEDYCFYGTIVRNTSRQPIAMQVRNWFARTPDSHDQPLKTKTQWIADWADAGVPFKWLMLADDVVFAPGDWLQGYSSVRLPRGSRFDLHYSWTLAGIRHDAVLADIECPPAQLPER